ncbi:IS630 transposase-related protein [Francisella sp. SYW-9]|uniref:IS630 transposase-related protein n=1 Tax=Francisella sp. SYW-9 TaxID=2610888 RepID=UPI00123CF3A4|nr:IS630 transposase-related protein [Francisella sp. SYW-9]
MAYSHHLIRKVFKLLNEGHSYRELASRFNIGLSTIIKWKKGILPQGKRNKPNTKLDLELLKEDVMLYPYAFHYERAARLGVKKSCIGNNLNKIGVIYKKDSKFSKYKRRKAIIQSEN